MPAKKTNATTRKQGSSEVDNFIETKLVTLRNCFPNTPIDRLQLLCGFLSEMTQDDWKKLHDHIEKTRLL